MAIWAGVVLLTFVAGLIPVAGNLISNTAVVLMSVTVSLELAVALRDARVRVRSANWKTQQEEG